ncbi:hypothetical protein [Motilimonas eburnea]|uniref:hypothetical protein n=1 Tax=Motilimonas eburnea TaxID=1737488 RepID=UPI001E5C01A7|nr:hypothetical protein [Motilimonas eburnea]MCE2571652.1 hypothetical protein [Motilimonas eburnea]
MQSTWPQHNNQQTMTHYPEPTPYQAGYQEQTGSNQPAKPREKSSLHFPEYFNVKAHGTKAACEVKPSVTQGGFYTIMLEAASAIQGSKSFQWQNKQDKISIQVTNEELIEVAAVFLGFSMGCKYGNHGIGDSSKQFEMKFQTNKYGPQIFIQLTEKGKTQKNVPIPMTKAIQMGMVALSQYISNFPGMTSDSAISVIKRYAELKKYADTLHQKKTNQS